MSVYKPAKSRYWAYDFQQQGRRFHGSTGQATRRKAEAVEAEFKLRAKLGTLHTTADMTLDVATQKWWLETGRYLGATKNVRPDREAGGGGAVLDDGDGRLADNIAVMVQLVGKNLLLTEITTAVVNQAIQKRRAQLTPAGRPPAARTVNLQIVSNLRRILRTARDVWEVPGLPVINWKRVKLAEPKPKVRGYSGEEVGDIKDHLAPYWHDMVDFARRYGPRLAEWFFPLDALDIPGRRLKLRDRKGGDDHWIPLLDDDVAMFAARLGRARAAKLDTVWFRELKNGRLKALTYNGASSAIREALKAVGLKQARGARIHDLRHTAGTEILRATGNLKVTQKLLGHVSIQSTMVYAHALESDLRAGLEVVAKGPDAAPDPVGKADDKSETAA